MGQWKWFNITCVRDLVVSHCHCFIAACVVSHCHRFIALSLGIFSHSEDHAENATRVKRSTVSRRARGRGSPEVVARARSLFLLRSPGHRSGHSLPPAHYTVVLPRCKMCACAYHWRVPAQTVEVALQCIEHRDPDSVHYIYTCMPQASARSLSICCDVKDVFFVEYIRFRRIERNINYGSSSSSFITIATLRIDVG